MTDASLGRYITRLIDLLYFFCDNRIVREIMSLWADKWSKLLLAMRQGWRFVSEDVWKFKSNNIFVHIIKTLNLSIRCFMNEQLQQRASALTYRTLLAIVPATALLLALGKGFGFNNILESHLAQALPFKHEQLEYFFNFVDAYMEEMKAGVFVGIGVVLLLWLLVNLLDEIVKTFNKLWSVPNRKLVRRLSDYLAMFFVLPLLLLASNAMSIFVSTALDNTLLSSMTQYIMHFLSYVLSWLLFTAVYMLLPNTKVKFKHAFVSGIICGTAFNISQWIYLSGQIWVSKYNAVYGSFAFLPLLMLWIQVAWLICLIGVVLSYSSQNVYNYEFQKEVRQISPRYYDKVVVIIMSIILQRKREGKHPMTCHELSYHYQIPVQLVSRAITDMTQADLLLPTPVEKDFAYIATVDSDVVTVEYLLQRIKQYGCENFVDTIDNLPADEVKVIDDYVYHSNEAGKRLLVDLAIPQETDNNY